MSVQPAASGSTGPLAGAPQDAPTRPAFRRRRPLPPVVNLLCFLATILTTLIGGTLFALDDATWPTVRDILLSPGLWLIGWPYSLSIILILGAHEMGHYVACRIYRVDATLPFFIPSPIQFGTFGAVIRIRAPIPSRRALFDVGVAGPIAGFVVALPVLLYALRHSAVVPGPPPTGGIEFPSPLLLDLVVTWAFPALGAPTATVFPHQTYWAAWLGVFATGLNLLPIGQLDGGHILYAVSGRLHAFVSRFGIPVLIVLGLWRGAYHLITFAVLFALIGYRHPPLMDEGEPLGPGRLAIAVAALLMFVLCVVVDGFRLT